jgi:5-methylcytosine-specific restriction enzyme subunit McrC
VSVALAPFKDLHPYTGTPTPEEHEWLHALAKLDPRDYRVGIEDGRPDAEFTPLVQLAPDGQWWAGRYIGAMSFQGGRLIIEPRLGIEVIEAWLDQAFGLAAPPVSSRQVESETFIARLLARLWCRAVDNATRHGLPLLRLPTSHEGRYLRGRLDVRRTARLIGSGREQIASIAYARSLAHPATRAIVCAEAVLRERLSQGGDWRTPRVKQVLPHLRAVVGSRPKLPTPVELARVRYTPITLPFKRVAELSQRIASRLGYGASDEEGAADGILIDVAELWELFLLNCAGQAAPPGVRVEHGARSERHAYLLRSSEDEHELGRLRPDILIIEGDTVRAVIDAKYKRLHDSRERPSGVDQADLYQLIAYALRFRPSAFSALLYPLDPGDPSPDVSTAERDGPWRSDEHRFVFRRLPTGADACREALGQLLTEKGTAVAIPAAA